MRATRDRTEWFAAIQQAALIRDQLYFSRRLAFDNELRPILSNGDRIAYPDATWHITTADVDRAEKAARE
jgi:hypothetical protein